MATKLFKGITLGLLLALLLTAATSGIYQYIIPDAVSCCNDSEPPDYPLLIRNDGAAATASASEFDPEGTRTLLRSDYKLFGIIPVKSVAVTKYSDLKLYPGGMPFGIKFMTDGVLVVGFCDIQSGGKTVNPSADAGLKINDMIKSVNGNLIKCADDLTEMVEKSGGKALKISYTRDGKEFSTSLTPAYSDTESRYKTGIYVRDSGAGIGTVSFIVPSSGAFGGLGHGICDSSTGELIPMQRGSSVEVTISGVVKGVPGTPGEVKGYFSSGKTGSLLGNTHCGVYGVFASVPENVPCEALPVGLRSEVKTGKAYIYCTLDTNKVEKYEIEIADIDRSAQGNKCFTVKVIDPALLEKTGGIIQGMSGSPIIQNGKIIGAVTHVLINDPSTGYGIFIENMLGAAQGMVNHELKQAS